MRLIFINSVYKKGSTGKLVQSLHNYCRCHEIESFVIYGRGKTIKDPYICKCSCELLSKINQLRAKITGFVYGGNFFATSKMIRIIKKIKPDIVHIHNLNDQYVNEYRLLKYLSKHKIKVVITLHSEQMYTGTCGYALECEQYVYGGCKKCPHIYLSTSSHIDKTMKAFKKLNTAYQMFKVDNLLFTSCTPWLKGRGDSSVLIGRFNNKVILNGGDDSVFKPISPDERNKTRKKYNLPLNKKIILHVNPRADDPIKGYQYLNELADLISSDSCICVVGKIPQNSTKKENVIHLGEIRDATTLAKLYASSDVTIMLSSRECFPMVIIESLLCGTPVVAFECGGPDKCYPSNIALFSEHGNLKAMIKNINKAFCINRENISVYAKQKLSINEMCGQFLKLYNEL